MPARTEPGGELRVVGSVASLTDGGRSALEDIDVLGCLRQGREALDAGRSGADEPDDLVTELGERLARATSGDLVVPPSRVERRSPELLHPGDGGELEEVEDPHGQHVVAAREVVAAIRADPPPGGVLVPLRPGHARVEQRIGHEVEPVGDRLQVQPDLLTERVPMLGDVPELLQHREVDGGLDVAHHPWVAVPVPGAADAAGLVEDADPLDAGLAQLSASEDPRDAAAYDHCVDVIGDGRAPTHGREGVLAERGEGLVARQIANVSAPGDQALVALGPVLGVDDLGIEVLVLAVSHHQPLIDPAAGSPYLT